LACGREQKKTSTNEGRGRWDGEGEPKKGSRKKLSESYYWVMVGGGGRAIRGREGGWKGDQENQNWGPLNGSEVPKKKKNRRAGALG